MPNLLHRKWAFLLPLVLLLCACAVSPKNTPFAELSSRVEAVLHTPADERKAYFALHYDDLLRAGQVAFPEEYSFPERKKQKNGRRALILLPTMKQPCWRSTKGTQRG